MENILIFIVFIGPFLFMEIMKTSISKRSQAYKIEVESEKIKKQCSAEQGDADAQFVLGFNYANGIDVNKDDQEAVRWYRLAADQEMAEAQYNLGLMYANGRGVEKNDSQAAYWFTLAAEQGNAEARFHLGLGCLNGIGVEKNDEEAAYWFWLSAEQGLPKAQYYLGSMYETGSGVDKSYEEAVEWLKLAANQGDADACYSLGRIYSVGAGTAIEKDKYLAQMWSDLARNYGHPEAQFEHGYELRFRKGDWKEAGRYFWLSAAQGNAKAQFYYGRMYEYGEHYTQDKKYAAAKYRLAAEQGLAEAQVQLAHLYMSGEGVPENYKESFKWFREASKQSNPRSVIGLTELSDIVEQHRCITANYGDYAVKANLIGVRSDPEYQFRYALMCLQIANASDLQLDYQEAFKWFCLSAEHGSTDAQSFLSSYCENIEGVAENIPEIISHYKLAREREANQTRPDDLRKNLGLYDEDIDSSYIFNSDKQSLTADPKNPHLLRKSALSYFLYGSVDDKEKAMGFLLSAAKLGDSKSQHDLAMEYLNNDKKHIGKAYIWLSMAAANGLSKAISTRNIVRDLLPPQSLEQAQAQAARCFESNYQDCD